MNLKKDLKSVQTTAMGVLAGISMLIPQVQNLLDGDPETTLSETVIISALALMGFGITAKDGDKSSEDVS
jgi:hypothetical protein